MLIHLGAAIALMSLAAVSNAEPYTPPATRVVAKWNSAQIHQLRNVRRDQVRSEDPSAAIELANAYLAEAAQPGQARLYGLAKALLRPLAEQSLNRADLWLAWARVQQHQHAFDEALAALDRVLLADPGNVSANLMAARIHLIQGDPAAAKNACLKLLGRIDLLTASACSLEVASYEGKLEPSYRQLSELVNREGLPDDERGPWLAQMLGDMATRLNSSKEATEWLNQRLQNADVGYLAQWADAHLNAANDQRVLNQLQPIVTNAPAIDDALLLRLAQAEMSLGGDHWQDQLAERVQLREQRQDTQHASELARYYLHIDPQPQKALQWARVNWRSAREPADQHLLEQALELASSEIKQEE